MTKSRRETPKRKFSHFYFCKEYVSGEKMIAVVAVITGNIVATIPIRQDENEAFHHARLLLHALNALYDSGGSLLLSALSAAEQSFVNHPPIGGHDPNLDVHTLLAERRQVAVIWTIDDVQLMRPGFTDAEAWAVLQECSRIHDCNEGFTWDLINAVADKLMFDKSQSGE